MPEIAITPENLVAQRRIAERAGRLSAPLFGEGQIVEPSEDAQILLDRVCEQSFTNWGLMAEDPVRTEVFARFCELLPLIGLVAVQHDPNTADWHWARVRCIISAAGFAAHAKLATLCSNLYPQCALRPDETRAQWDEALEVAHRNSGWPVTLGLVPWRDLMTVYGAVDEDELRERDSRWWRAAALLHVLKHVRDEGDRVVIAYRGTAGYLKLEDGTNVIGQMRRLKGQLLGLLQAVTLGDGVNPLAQAASSVLGILTTRNLLSRRPLAQLPGTILHGPWSSVFPDPARVEGFIQHGLRLSGVWLANRGTVSTHGGSDADVTGFQWRLEGETEELRQARERFAASIPARFSVEFPTNLLRWAFPNLVPTMFTDVEAGLSIYDALICLSVVRSDMAGAELEYPMLLVMPSDPSPEDSTNQGKSKCAMLLAQAMTPGIPITNAPDNESAPDQRSLAATITDYGSLCLDEWRQAKSKNALLSHDSLQSLLTGGTRSLGRVFENNSVLIKLRQPIVASTKCANLPPDLQNRSVCVWLSTLADEVRDRLDVVAEMDSGRLPLKLRLAAVALCQEYGLAKAAPRASAAFRFPVTFGLACELYRLKTNKPVAECAVAMALAVTEMRDHLVKHTSQAEDSGLLSMQEDAQSVRVRLSSIFDNMTTSEVEAMEAATKMRDPDGRVTPGGLVKARGEQVALGSRPLCAIVSFVTGSRVSVSDRALAMSFARDIRRHMPRLGDEWILPDTPGLAGWRLKRVDDMNFSPRVKLVRVEQ